MKTELANLEAIFNDQILLEIVALGNSIFQWKSKCACCKTFLQLFSFKQICKGLFFDQESGPRLEFISSQDKTIVIMARKLLSQHTSFLNFHKIIPSLSFWNIDLIITFSKFLVETLLNVDVFLDDTQWKVKITRMLFLSIKNDKEESIKLRISVWHYLCYKKTT